MDFVLRCNSLKCRAQLIDRAVVTTCSHIFCVNCSNAYGLANTVLNDRICPACETRLVNPDDIVATSLNPSEDYKTSVLSGLSPANIMECAGRGLNFYTYQATQEILYQEYLSKSLTDKYDRLSTQLDQVIHDANSEIASLRNNVHALQAEREDLYRKNNSLREAYNDKVRQYQKSQATYDKLKKKLLESDVQLAAEDAVHHALNRQASNLTPGQSIPNSTNRLFAEHIHRRQKSGGSYNTEESVRPRQRSHPSLNGPVADQSPNAPNYHPQHRARYPLVNQEAGWINKPVESNRIQAQNTSRTPITGHNRARGFISPEMSRLNGNWHSNLRNDRNQRI